ncbi:acyltransferase family protein [bacterium]|nr:acyltransferase family protein [bacterium]
MENPMEKRNFLFDNLKCLLIFLVVYGHFIENFQSIYASESTRIVYQFIYLFHMPGFVFVSGYFARKGDGKIFEKVLLNQIVPLFFFQLVFEIFHWVVFHEFSGKTLDLAPYWILWYLLSLAFWRISFQLLYKIRFLLLISVILALVAGMVSSIGYPLSVSRTVVLFPFFVLGNIFKEKGIVEKIKSGRFFPVYAVLSVLVLAGALIYVSEVKLHYGLYLNSYSYKALKMAWDEGMLYRFINLAWGFLCIASLLVLTPQKRCFASKIGKNSMIPYIMQFFFLKSLLIYRFDFYKNLYFTFIGGAVFAALIVYIFGKDRFSALYEKLMLKIYKIVTCKDKV